MTLGKRISGCIAAAGVLLSASPLVAQPRQVGPVDPLPQKFTGDEIKAGWFDGKPFTATAPDGTSFVMTFTADGKSSRKPTEKKKGLTGATGFWRVIAEGYCSRWSGQNREKCFNVRPDPADPKAVVVRFGPQQVATWKR